MKRNLTYLFLSFLGLLMFACQPEESNFTTGAYTSTQYETLSDALDLPSNPFDYGVDASGEDLKIDHVGTLGRVLFYDKNLSADASVSCASCHQQSLAFSDDKALSLGANGNQTQRNSIALGAFNHFGNHYDQSNLDRKVPGLFWDERAESIQEQLRQTIANPDEMGMQLDQIVDLVNHKDYYQILNQKAFNELEITEEHVLEALETFINSIGNKGSKFETEIVGTLNFISGDSISGLSELGMGFELFQQNCNSCHGGNLNLPANISDEETIVSMANNGLEILNDDLGAFEHTMDPNDIGKFKIPGLRNIELTAPYMHDGRFETLEEVVEHYNSGISNSPSLHPNLVEDNNAKRMQLSSEEKEALVSFLKSLTNEGILEDKKWSNPFLI